MNRAIYTASEKIIKPNYIAIAKEYIYYNPIANKVNMRIPVKIVFIDVEVEDGVVLSGTYKLVDQKRTTGSRLLMQSGLDHNIFNLEDEQKCNALFCKAMLFYAPHQIKKKDQKFIDEFSDEYPELMV